jgi:hypothetical protein
MQIPADGQGSLRAGSSNCHTILVDGFPLAATYFACGESTMSEGTKRLVCEAAIAVVGMLPVALLAYVLFR